MAEVKQLLSLILDTFDSNGGHELVAGSSEVSGHVHCSVGIVGHSCVSNSVEKLIRWIVECFFLWA